VRSLDSLAFDPFDVRADFAVLAVGFGLEKTLDRVPARSYWLNDSLHQELAFAPPEPRRVLVSGSGDGGLIDALRLCLVPAAVHPGPQPARAGRAGVVG
jgi:hypothetical protein